MSEPPQTYSIVLRVRRVIYEDAYIGVPVTSAIMKPEAEADGTHRIDSEAFMAEALRISNDPRVEWRQESTATEPHPLQQPMPEDRRKFDAFYTDTSDSEV